MDYLGTKNTEAIETKILITVINTAKLREGLLSSRRNNGKNSNR